METLIAVQDAYIARLKAIRARPRRTNAMLTANASRAAFKAFLALGFTHDQANQALNDATDVYFLDVNARSDSSGNLSESWESKDKRYKKCPKCNNTGTQVSKARRNYSTCTQCHGTGWKFVGEGGKA